MKVKIFSDSYINRLEEHINAFLATVESVIDIKISTCDKSCEVLVMYNEKAV